MKFSNIYYELYNDIANYRVLTKEQVDKIESLTPEERLNLLKVYNDVIKTLKDSNVLD